MAYPADPAEPMECTVCLWAGRRDSCVIVDGIEVCRACKMPVACLCDPPAILDTTGDEYDPMAVTPER